MVELVDLAIVLVVSLAYSPEKWAEEYLQDLLLPIQFLVAFLGAVGHQETLFRDWVMGLASHALAITVGHMPHLPSSRLLLLLPPPLHPHPLPLLLHIDALCKAIP